MTERELMVQKIKNAVYEVQEASGIHKRDLIRHVYRLKKQLMEYDRYQQMLGNYNVPIAQRGD